MPWANANAYCTSNFGTHLAEVLTPADNQIIRNLIGTSSSSLYWIGYTDQYDEGVFSWNTNGNYGGYTNWHCGEPNAFYPHEDCGAIQPSGGTWFDTPCNYNLQFVCNRY